MEKLYSYYRRIQELKQNLNHDCGMRECSGLSTDIHAEKRRTIFHLEELLEALVKEIQ